MKSSTAVALGLVIISLLATGWVIMERRTRSLVNEATGAIYSRFSEELSGIKKTADQLETDFLAVKEQNRNGTVVSAPSVSSASSKTSSSTSNSKPVATNSTKSPSSTAQEAAPTGAVGTVNINSASREELMTLPGIGESYAQRIIDARPFSSVDDLDRVKGIGPKTLEKLRPQVSI